MKIDKAPTTAEIKVSKDTTCVCFTIPEGTPQTIASELDLTPSLIDENIQLWLSGSPSTGQRKNKSGDPNSTLA